MKVQELIEKLKTFDPDMTVVTRGLDEAGFDDIGEREIVRVQPRRSEATRQSLGEYEESKTDGRPALLIDHT